MSKYSIDFKLKIINEIKKDNVSYNDLERKYNIDHSLIIDWYKKYEKNGKNAFLIKKQKYNGAFKKYIVEYKKSNNLSVRDTMVLFNIPGKSQIVNWEKIYDEKGPDVLYEEHRGRKKKLMKKKSNKKKELTHEEELLQEIEQLRMENEYLKKLNALVQERIKRENKKK